MGLERRRTAAQSGEKTRDTVRDGPTLGTRPISAAFCLGTNVRNKLFELGRKAGAEARDQAHLGALVVVGAATGLSWCELGAWVAGLLAGWRR